MPKPSAKRKLGQYKRTRTAKTKGFSLTIRDFLQTFNNYCYYCGDKYLSLGFDRINSDDGYFKENVVLCCITCNRMKMDLSQEEFLKQVQKIYTRTWVV